MSCESLMTWETTRHVDIYRTYILLFPRRYEDPESSELDALLKEIQIVFLSIEFPSLCHNLFIYSSSRKFRGARWNGMVFVFSRKTHSVANICKRFRITNFLQSFPSEYPWKMNKKSKARSFCKGNEMHLCSFCIFNSHIDKFTMMRKV